MNVASPGFLVGVLVFAVLIFLLPPGRPRQLLFAACSAGFLATYVPNLASWAALAAFVLSGYFAALAARKLAGAKSYSPFLASYVALLVGAFLLLKRYRFLEALVPPRLFHSSLVIIGLSYMLFRQIHFLVDTAEAQIESPSLWEYLNYQFDLFTLLAGPIQRFQNFRESFTSLHRLTTDWLEVVRLHARLFLGVIKVALIGALFLRWTEMAGATQLHVWNPTDIGKFAILFYLYPLYVYFNFSGYCDIAIAGAALAGMRLPENFDRPYLARNVIDFWARWHITLTTWIRDYVFMAMYKGGVRRWPSRAGTITYICYFVALFLAGVWHGSSWNFMVFGLLHGAGVSVSKMWEDHIVRQRGRKGLKEYLKSKPTRAVAIFLTMHFVCFTFLFFPTDLRGRIEFLRRFVLERPAAAAAHAVRPQDRP